MKKTALLILLFSAGCQTPADYFNRPNISPAINNECSAYKEGELIDATNFISVSPEEYIIIQEYFENKERRLYYCLRFGDCE